MAATSLSLVIKVDMKRTWLLLTILLLCFAGGVNAQSGVRVLNYSHGKYVGETLNGQASGNGTYTAARSGVIYSGQFVADTFNGQGTMLWPNGDRFVGTWKSDSAVSGTMTYANGEMASGIVRNAVFIPNQPALPMSKGPASAQVGESKVTDFPDGWHNITFEDLRGTDDYEYRKKDPGRGVEVRGDIDNDGRMDKVRLMQKNDMSRCAVIATLNKRDGYSHKVLMEAKGRCNFYAPSYFVTTLQQKPDIRAFQFAVGAYGKGYSRYYYEQGKFIQIVESD